MAGPGGAVARWGPPVGAALVAVGCAGLLAATLGARYDELHTLSHTDDAGLVALWRSYRDARDTLPPLGYVAAWAWAQVAGDGLAAARAPIVASWGLAAAAIAVLVRRAGPWAALVAGLVPTATALAYLGAFARPYAPALAAGAIGLLAGQRAAERPRATGWLVATAVAFALAVGLHYLLVVVPISAAGAAAWARGARWRARAAAALGGAALPLLVSAPLVRQAAADQGRLPRSAGLRDVATFWPSTLRPAALAWLVGAVLVGVIVARRPAVRSGGVGRELVVASSALVLAGPVLVVTAMALTSGTYVHRYAVGALLGAAVLVGSAVGAADRRARWAGPALAGLALVAVVAAGVQVRSSFVGARAVDRLVVDLGLDPSAGEPAPPVLVLDEYELLLLRLAGGPELDARLLLGAPATVVGGPQPVDVDALLARTGQAGRSLLVVGDLGQVAALLEAHPGWTASNQAEASYPRPGGERTVVTVRLDPAR